ncbi:MmgE/PrpD family protein [Jannaschia aquimarina]|uniref:MmgE/PrpD family protein n=2 Tax=Jannaschia aquimarina TaxID=935700 RepID=A0A0D1EMH7_9RHOB|nr:MmgE/PrpD family protein [Jannaschia aquimarina]
MLRLSMLDWAACALAGRREPSAIAARSLASEAALWATAGHALDYDDTHFDHIGHVTTVVLPAALSVARDWPTLERATLAGAEAAIRMGVWLGRGHYAAGFHQTATAGAFGATLAAARAMELDTSATANALALCASRAAGLKAQFGTDGKPLNAGFAAQAGIDCAHLGAAGATAPAEAIESYGATHAGQGATPPSGPRFHAVRHKLHACCHGLHAALEAYRSLSPDDLSSIVVTTHPRWLSVCNQPAPTTGLGAKFSYRHALALAASGHDTSDPESFSDALTRDAGVVAMRDRVCVETDDSLADTAARVNVDGTVAAHDLADPMPLDELSGRIRSKVGKLVGEETAGRIGGAVECGDLQAYCAEVTARLNSESA